jgi:hypothetical protein
MEKRFYVTAEVDGKEFCSYQKTGGNPQSFDYSAVDYTEGKTLDGKNLTIIALYGEEFLVNGERVGYFDISTCWHIDKEEQKRRYRSLRRKKARLFHKLTGVGYNKVGRALFKAYRDYRDDPMGCPEDYE